MAGQSFVKGFFDHADVDEFIAMSNTKKRLEAFEQIEKIRRIQAGQRRSKQRATAVTSTGRDVYLYAELS